MKCNKCNKELREEEMICNDCRCNVDSNIEYVSNFKKYLFGFFSFMIPLIGFIFYFYYRNKNRNIANFLGIIGLASYIINFLFYMYY